jgi:hypothetical protein
MATLSADKIRKFRNCAPTTQHPVVASDIIYRGAAVTRNTNGECSPGNTTDTVFMGFTDAQVDNSAGSANAKNVEVFPAGEVYIPVTGADDANDEGSAVYLTDDDTFTLTATGGLAIGKVVQWDTSTSCWVRFEAASNRSI